jgi:hypothetical protein
MYGVTTSAASQEQLITIPFSIDVGIKAIYHRPSTLNPENSQTHTPHQQSTNSSLQLPIREASNTSKQQIGINVSALPTVLESNLFIAGSHNGNTKAYMLSQEMAARSRIVLQELDGDGIAKEHHLTLLPQSTSLNHSHVSLLPSSFSGGEKRKREMGLVINKSAQDTYRVDDVSDFPLPALLKRTVESIPTLTCGDLEYRDGEGTKRRNIAGSFDQSNALERQGDTDSKWL